MIRKIELTQGFTALGVGIPVARQEDLPTLMRKRKQITGYELNSIFDITVGDTVVKELHEQLGLAHDERLLIRVTPSIQNNVLYVWYACMLPTSKSNHLNMELVKTALDTTIEHLGTQNLVA